MSDDFSDDAFDDSPVPAKRRRLNRSAAIFDDSESDNAFESIPVNANTKRRSTSTSEENSVEPGKRPAKKPAKPKQRVVIHTNGPQLEDTFQTQLPGGNEPPSSPWRIRGARWQKPAKPPQVAEPTKAAAPPRQTVMIPSSEPRIVDGPSEPLPARPITKAETLLLDTKPTIPSLPQPPQQAVDFDIAQELADLPSDAFTSSSGSLQKSPTRQSHPSVFISSSPNASTSRQQRPPALKAPQNGLQQMTLFGMTAQGQQTDGNNKPKKHNWPLAQKDEPPTHHKLDQEAMKTYVYPTNLGKIRDYQYSIVKRGLYHNLLVALPTGLGKTFIAATIMLNWYRWTKDAQIVFVAPTKPLVSQQVEACFGIAGIPRSQTSMLTGGISPGLRAEEWTNKRVFFLTPQTLINDLKTGIADPKRVVLLVVDEAHRATGNYAYVEVVKFLRRFNQSFRVLALTATPGGTMEAVQEVINGLQISRVEIRTEFSIDIREYVYNRNTEMVTFEPNDEMELVMDLFSKTLNPMLQKLRAQNGYWTADPMQLTAYGLNQGRQKWMLSAGKNAEPALKGMMNRIFAVLASLAHNIELLKFHGISPFYHKLVAFRSDVDTIKGGKYEKQVTENEHFQKMMRTISVWVSKDTFVGHPKLEHLQQVVMTHFLDAGEGREGQPPSATRIMIFAHFRDSAEDIVRVLRRNSPMIRPHVFVGQAGTKGSEGMSQKEQLEVIHDFKLGKYNTLVATSIGEEGLDIGEIDLIICYDSSASPIRMLQRMGRTGRKRAGNILLLLMKGKEENSFVQAKDGYEKMQKMIAEGNRFEFHEESARRIVPKGIEPVVDKRVVEIPVENTQAELPEPKKKGRAAPKRPKKKFHMPDGVITGFVRASKLNGNDSDASEDDRPAPRRRAPKKPVEELEPIPALEQVLLNEAQDHELFTKFQDIPYAEGVDLTIERPSLSRHPQRQRSLAPHHALRHGGATTSAVKALHAMRQVDARRISTLVRLSQNFDPENAGSRRRVTYSDAEASDTESRLPPQPKARKAPTKTPRTTKPKATTTRAPTKPPAAPKPKAPPKARTTAAKPKTPTTKQRRQARPLNLSDPIEAPPSSSPPPTDPRLQLATQGIDLGSGDTSGEEMLEGEPSSDLRDFVVEEEGEDLGYGGAVREDDVGSESDGDGTEIGGTQDLIASGRKRQGKGRRGLSQLVESSDDGGAGSDFEDSGEELPSLNTIIGGRNKSQAKTARGALGAKRKRRVVDDSSE